MTKKRKSRTKLTLVMPPLSWPADKDLTGIANFMRHSGERPIQSASDPRLTTISLGRQKWQVHKAAARYFQGFLNDLQKAGCPDLISEGGWVYRKIRGGGGLSQHAYGNAIDVRQEGFGGTIWHPQNGMEYFARWARDPSTPYFATIKKWHIYSGERFGDLGHFEWGGVPFSQEELKALETPPAEPTETIVLKYLQEFVGQPNTPEVREAIVRKLVNIAEGSQ